MNTQNGLSAAIREMLDAKMFASFDSILKTYIPIPPAIGKEEHRGILTGSSDPDGGADYPERAITSVIDDFEAIGKRLKEIQAEKDIDK